MSIRDIPLKSEYRSFADNVVQSFYLPVLSEAATYRRAVGFFSSSSLVEITKGICSLAERKGKIQIVASPRLSQDDIEAIQKGYEERDRRGDEERDKIVQEALLREMQEKPMDAFSLERLKLLSCLVRDGVLDIRIAFMESGHDVGMYHEKMGLMADAEGNCVAFSGSMNETAVAMSVNYETVDVFRSWGAGDEPDRVRRKQQAFDDIWNDRAHGIRVREFPAVKEELIATYATGEPDFTLDRRQFPKLDSRFGNDSASYQEDIQVRDCPRIPESVTLYDYQQEAISNWVGENYRGIFDMATGTGKTLTGLGAVAKLSQDLHDRLAVIILCPYQHLVEQWVEDIRAFGMKPIIGYSSSAQKDWKKRLSNAVTYANELPDRSFFCFVSTNDTFVSAAVQKEINRIQVPILLVVDEAHNVGATTYRKTLDDRFTYRLALSATLERYRDEEGTRFLCGFFGCKCIEYDLERAIREKKLTPYRYHPILVYLEPDELDSYEDLSYQMSRNLIKDRSGHYKLNKKGEILALQRSRLVAGAFGKLSALRNAMQPYRNEYNILVYCGTSTVAGLETEDEEIRQIDAVIAILGNEMKMSVARFTSQENMQTRMELRDHFSEGIGLQALVAIKCLDEGVNIPGIRTAFILASTTNPKEYIQRRGRVLRRSPGKHMAEIYDFVTLPRPLKTVSGLTVEQAGRDLSLVRREMARVEEFGRLAENSMEAYQLIWDVKDTYHIYDDFKNRNDDMWKG